MFRQDVRRCGSITYCSRLSRATHKRQSVAPCPATFQQCVTRENFPPGRAALAPYEARYEGLGEVCDGALMAACAHLKVPPSGCRRRHRLSGLFGDVTPPRYFTRNFVYLAHSQIGNFCRRGEVHRPYSVGAYRN